MVEDPGSLPPPRVRLWDHVRVAWVLVLTLLGIVPFLVWFLLSPVLQPWVRGRLRRRIARAGPRAPDEPPAPDPEAWRGRTVFVVAGEPSGDELAARVVAAMKLRCPGLRVRGYAGPATAAAGATLDRDLISHAVFGVTAVIRSLGFWWNICAETLARIRDDPPDVFLTVDFPGLNGRLARWARKRGITTVHLVPPSTWAYAPWRSLRWRLALDRLLTVFPFEAAMFEGVGIPCTHVGHPLFEAPLAPPRTPSSWPGAGDCTVELLPGSRRQEIRGHTPILMDAAARIDERLARAHFVVRLADTDHRTDFEQASAEVEHRPERLQVVVGAYEAPAGRPLIGALATSGTVTAELGAALVPLSLFYRVSILGRIGVLLAVTAPWIGLVNLIAGRDVAPERLVLGSDGTKVALDFLGVTGDPARWTETRETLDTRVRGGLETAGVADRAARAVFDAFSSRR